MTNVFLTCSKYFFHGGDRLGDNFVKFLTICPTNVFHIKRYVHSANLSLLGRGNRKESARLTLIYLFFGNKSVVVLMVLTNVYLQIEIFNNFGQKWIVIISSHIKVHMRPKKILPW